MHPRFGTKQKLDKEKLEIEILDMKTSMSDKKWDMRTEYWVRSKPNTR